LDPGKISEIAGPRQQQQFRGVNRLIEATSLEGIAKIRQGKNPNDELEKLTKEQTIEIVKLATILEKQDELQALGV